MGSQITESLPYWQVNVPEAERTDECPEFLRALSEKDRRIISTPDADYTLRTWPEVRGFIRENRLDLFQRVPSDLRKYLAYNWRLKQEYGSVMRYILSERLRWDTPIVARGKPFVCEEDVRILWNDWPYGLDARIVHLVVWTKFEIEEDPVTSDLTDEARREIEGFLGRLFGSRVPEENYIWFKNWRSLKSVKAVEHFHVMIYDPDPAFIDDITNGDVPLIRKVQQQLPN